MATLQIPRNVDSKNIFLLIQELLSNQKTNAKKYGQVLALSIVDRLKKQYEKNLDEWAEKSAELKAKLSEEYTEMKESLNAKAGWFLGGLVVAGAIFGVLAGPVIGIVGGTAALLGGFGGAALAGGGILGDYLSSKSKSFFDSKEKIDPLKMKEKELQIMPISDEAQAIQVRANMKQGEISRKTQAIEADHQLVTAASNMIASLLKIFGRTSDMMGRG